MKINFRFFSGLFLLVFLISCAGQEQPVREVQNTETQLKEQNGGHFVYSLYENTENGSFQIYRDGEKFSSFRIDKCCKPLSMKLYSGDCYILVSQTQPDSVKKVSEIYKNGRSVMYFQADFSASDFEVQNGHFFVLGGFSDTTVTVFRDGLRKISIKGKGLKPSKIAVSGDDVYFAAEKNSVTEIYKNGEKIFDIPALNCTCFDVCGDNVYVMAGGKIYRDGKIFMSGNVYYKFFDNNLNAAAPECFSANGTRCYIGVNSLMENSKKRYATVFEDKEHFNTVKPDDKPLGKSEFQTRCRAVSACNSGVYYVTQNVNPDKNKVQNIYHYYFNTEEMFKIEPMSEKVKLLYIKGK